MRVQQAVRYRLGVHGLYKPLWTTLANTRVFNEAVVDDAAIKPKKLTRVVIPIPTQEELNEIANAPEPEEKVEEKRQTRSLVRKRNQEALRAAANETVLGDEDEVVHNTPCLPDHDGDDNSKRRKRRSCDPLQDDVTVPPGRSCLTDGVENLFEEKDPFPYKPLKTSCGWSTQPQLPGLEGDENEEEALALSEEQADTPSKEKEKADPVTIDREDQDEIRDDFERGTLIENEVLGKTRAGSATKMDPHHAFPDLVDNFVGNAQKFSIPTKGVGGKVVRHSELYQIEGSLNGRAGIFEWIVDQDKVTHRRFIPNGKVTGYPNQIPQED